MSAVIDTPAAAEAAPAPEPEMRVMERVYIVPSLTNPRKTFNPAKMKELEDSARANGIMQPIVIRPLPASRLGETFESRARNAPLPTHEIVFGERRWRASGPAGLKSIPTIIRHLTDEQVLEFQIVENLQREDVSELEEAEGYQFLMEKAGMSADQVAEKIGKSRAYVYSRTKVLDLCQVGRIALRDGKLDFSKGLLIARIPSESQQLKAIKALTETYHDGELRIGARKAAEHIREHYMLPLDKAPFSRLDADLLPGAGACTSCSKRTGANPELYSDVKSADVCTDSPCYHKKEEAHALRLAEEAKAKGQNVITGEEAKELVVDNTRYHQVPKLKGYRRLDHADDSPTDQPLRKIIGKQMKAEGIEPTKIEHPRKAGEFLDCLPNEVALRLIKTVEAAAKAEGAKAVSKEVQKLVDEKKAKAEVRAKAQYEQAWRNQLLASAWAEIKTGDYECFTLEVHRYVLLREAASLSVEDAEAIADILGLGRVGAHSAVIDQCKTTEHPDILHLLLIMQRASAANDYGYQRPANEGLMLVAGAAHTDRLPVVIRDVQAAAKAKYLSAPVESAAPKGASTPKPAAQASSTRAQGKGKKGPAAQAPVTAKTTAEEASAQIAAELARIEETNQAPAAQSNEGPAVADAQPGTAPSSGDGGASEALNQAPAAHGDEAPPAAPAPAAPSPSTKASARAKKGAASTEDSTPAPTAAPAVAIEIAPGLRVRVSADVYAAEKQAYAGKEGTVAGPLKGFKGTWRVDFDQADIGEAKPTNTFKAKELEVIP
ncbi:ParB/RepB/Spo0J family partition protein [Acidovorax sp. LjRoot118]|uniref:ParB/RepB/Spo0J family partition protein n=1 Tax=Acidovorax sp. LjRoot118 TaxID=3342256 RepID=UPI003ECF74CA